MGLYGSAETRKSVRNIKNPSKVIKVGIVCLVVFFLVILCLGLVLARKLHPNEWFVKSYSVKGTDISHYQGETDMASWKEQDIRFVYIKATEGSSHVDEQFEANWREAEEQDLLVGAYHFFSFDSPGEKQAEHFIRTVGDLSGKLIPVLDVEYYGDKEKNPPKKNELNQELTACLKRLEEEYHAKPMLYTTYKVYYRYLKKDFSDYPLWIRNVYFKPGWELGRKWDFWQYTDTAHLEGYQGEEKYIDCNVFRGTWEELEKYRIDIETI